MPTWNLPCVLAEDMLKSAIRMTTNPTEKALELKVGVFVTVGLAVLAAMLVQFGRVGEGFKSYYKLTVRLP